MKSRPFFLLILFFFNSCLVIKIYESPEPKTKDPEKPQQVRRDLIGSGKIIELGQGGSQEILFFDQENIPKGYLFEEDATVKEGQQVDTSMIWINSDKKEKIKIITTDQAKPLLVVDGEVWTDLNMIETIVPDAIETMNVLKGDAAFKKYGKKGLNGVIEITIKKN